MEPTNSSTLIIEHH